MRTARRVAGAAVLALVVVVVSASAAAAHASLESSDPADGARLDAAPAAVTLTFNEAVTAGLGAVRVFDAEGERVDDANVTASDVTVIVGLRPDLGDGAYVVTYRVVSEDGHPVRGATTFTVGDAVAATDDVVSGLLGSGEDKAWEVAGAVARGFAYAGALVAAGLAAFLVLAHDGGPDAPRLRRVLAIAAGVGAVALLAQVPITAALATGLGFGALGETGVLGQVLGDGVAVMLVLVLAGLGLLVLVPVGHDDAGTVPAARPVALAAAVMVTAGYAVAGHTAITEPRWPVSMADAMHATGGAVWVGGLVGVAIVLHARRHSDAAARPGRDDADTDPGATPSTATGTGAVVARFSGVAAVALVAIGGAGIALAWSQVRTLDALTSTTYGRLLIAKVAVVIVVAGLGAWNRFRLVPALERAPKAAGSRLRRIVGVEAIGLLGVLALTGILVQVTPARAAITAVYSETVPLGDGSVNLVVDPPRAGRTSIHMYVLDSRGRPFDPQEVTVELSLDSAGVGPIERRPFVAGPGHFQLDGSDLSIPGTWTIAVEARTDRFDQEVAEFSVPIRP